MVEVTIRKGNKEDLPRVLELVKELAEYEKAPEQVTNTVERMEQEGFGPAPVFGMFVAELKKQVIGIAVYYYRYSTWKGKRLYLEDIIVTEKERGKGIGKMLFDRTLKQAMDEECSGMTWQVLDWNTPALNFYQKYRANLDKGWLNYHLELNEIKAILSS